MDSGRSAESSRPPRTVLRNQRTQRRHTVVLLGSATMLEPQVVLLGADDSALTAFGPCEAADATDLGQRLARRHGAACFTLPMPLLPADTARPGTPTPGTASRHR